MTARHPGSKEGELISPKFVVAHDGEDFFTYVMRHYKIDKDVIGAFGCDRASRTRRGLEYYPKAMYQASLHLRWRTYLGSKCLGRLHEELDIGQPFGDRESCPHLWTQLRGLGWCDMSALILYNIGIKWLFP